MRLTIPKEERRGSALILVIILLAVALIGGSALWMTNKSLFDFSGFFRAKTSLQMEAETGLALSEADLSVLAQGTRAFCPTPPPDPNDDLVKQGLCYSPLRPTPFVRREPPSHGGTVERKVYYLPDPENEVDNNAFPKFWHIISVATNTVSGNSHTVEAFVQLWPENFSEIMFGLLAPGLATGQIPTERSFTFAPGTYDGHVHFASYPEPASFGKMYPYFAEQFSEALDNTIPMLFLGPVTFADGLLPASDYPFKVDTGLPVRFEKGFIVNHDIKTEPDKYFDAVSKYPGAKILTPGANGKVCLKLDQKIGSSVGEIWEYECQNDPLTPFPAYVGEVTLTAGFDPLTDDNDTYTSNDVTINKPAASKIYPSDGVVYCPGNCTIGIKGVLKGALTIAAQNIEVHGDIQYFDQTPTSTDRLGVLARNDIIIPPYVPQERSVYWGYNIDANRYADESPYSSHKVAGVWTGGVTNFIVDEDRDKGDTDYYPRPETLPTGTPTATVTPKMYWGNNPEGRVQGQTNSVSVLDLDGAFFAVEGKFDVAGLNDRTTNPQKGVVMRDKNGVLYTLEYGKPNSYYEKQNVSGTDYAFRKEAPRYCFWHGWQTLRPTSDTCPQSCPNPACPSTDDPATAFWEPTNMWELNRQENYAIWVHGSLVAKEFSITRFWPYGFNRRILHEDPRFHRRELQPLGFPDTGNPALQVLWMKNYRGRPNHPNIP